MDLKHLLKRGALLVAANWQIVAIRFAAQVTFQALLAVPVVGAAILVAVLLGADLANVLQGNFRETVQTVSGLLAAEPVALGAFVSSFTIVLFGGSVFMFLVKGGTIHVLGAANEAAGPIEHDAVTLDGLRPAAAYTVERFLAGCSRLFGRYLALGMLLMVVYGASAAAYLAVVLGSFRAVASDESVVGWAFVAALLAVVLVLWITLVNLVYLLLQIAVAVEDLGILEAWGAVARFVRHEFRELSGVFLVVLALVIGATLASALAWSGVGLVAFVPLVGLAVFPLQILALLLRGLVFEYIGLTALGAYLTLYRRQARAPRSARLEWAPARARE